ncbi:Rv1893 family protein [Mycobacterium sp.]|uniref:Rv1893 family protein n=1 Tax=Mycobacterium sp. TaxID=1785 RepID=UPI003F960BE2
MGFNAKDALDAAKDIVTNAVERSSDIVEDAGHIIKGDIAGGTGDIVHNSLDIATYAFGRAKEVFTGNYADDDGDE